MALTANRDVDHYVDQELRAIAVASGAHIYKGAFVEWNASGYAQPVTGAGAFAGIAYEELDNTGGNDGDISGRVYTLGDFEHTLSGAVAADVGRDVFASDDATLTFDGDAATFVGRVRAIPSSGKIVLRLASEGGMATERLDHRTASFTVTAGQSGKTFTNRGASGVITATLPQTPPEGTRYSFVCMADQALRVAPGTGGGVYVKGAKQADNKYVQISDIGDFLQLVADDAGDWVAVASIGGADGDIAVEA